MHFFLDFEGELGEGEVIFIYESKRDYYSIAKGAYSLIVSKGTGSPPKVRHNLL